MATPSTIKEAIDANAREGVKSVKVGEERTERHDLTQQIAAANHVAAQDASTHDYLGIRFRVIKPPGTG